MARTPPTPFGPRPTFAFSPNPETPTRIRIQQRIDPKMFDRSVLQIPVGLPVFGHQSKRPSRANWLSPRLPSPRERGNRKLPRKFRRRTAPTRKGYRPDPMDIPRAIVQQLTFNANRRLIISLESARTARVAWIDDDFWKQRVIAVAFVRSSCCVKAGSKAKTHTNTMGTEQIIIF